MESVSKVTPNITQKIAEESRVVSWRQRKSDCGDMKIAKLFHGSILSDESAPRRPDQ